MSRLGVVVAVAAFVAAAAAPARASEAKPTLSKIEAKIVCPTCRTTLDQSTSPIAERMRAFIRARIAAGDTKSEIKAKLVRQFGPQVVEPAPPPRGFDLLAWLLPAAGAAVGAALLALLAWRWSRRDVVDARLQDAEAPLDPALARRVDDELVRFEG